MSNEGYLKSPQYVEDLEALIEMNLGDYITTLAEQDPADFEGTDTTLQKHLALVQSMIRVLYVLGEQAGIDVNKFDVDGLAETYL